MIRYALKCQNDHAFESWFRSNEGYEALKASGGLACPVCGGAGVEKALMAPAVRPAAARPPTDRPHEDRPLSAPDSEMERKLVELRRKVEETSEYVGRNFATEARAIHDGDAPARPIHGEAKAEEARRLMEDGVPVAPLPFGPPRKAN